MLSRSQLAHIYRTSDSWKTLTFRSQQSRTVRTKGGTGFYTDAIRRDERLLRRLEAQLTHVQAKIKREEEEAAELMKKQAHHGSGAGPGNRTVENHNYYFWEKVLTQGDRRELASHGIRTLDELYSVYETAEATITRPPYPKIEQLEPRLRFAHEMYKSIPAKLSEAGRAKAKSPFGGWF